MNPAPKPIATSEPLTEEASIDAAAASIFAGLDNPANGDPVTLEQLTTLLVSLGALASPAPPVLRRSHLEALCIWAANRDESHAELVKRREEDKNAALVIRELFGEEILANPEAFNCTPLEVFMRYTRARKSRKATSFTAKNPARKET